MLAKDTRSIESFVEYARIVTSKEPYVIEALVWLRLTLIADPEAS